MDIHTYIYICMYIHIYMYIYVYIYMYDESKLDGPGFDSQHGQAFYLPQNVLTGSGAHSAFRSMGVEGSYRGSKQPGRS
jgi:hypothetical protein